MKFLKISLVVLSTTLLGSLGCEHADEHEHHEGHTHKIVVTNPVAKDVTTTQRYVCQIHSCRHIEVKAIENGYLEAIPVNEGQTVKEGEMMFKILPTLYQAHLDSDLAEAQVAEIEFANAENLLRKQVISEQEVALVKAKLAKAKARVESSKAELNFTNIRAPFGGIIDRLLCQQGSLVSEGDVLTTLSDNSTMWVYFNVPEARYLEYASRAKSTDAPLEVELILADHSTFGQIGRIGAIEADFNNATGNIAFRADFPNPDRILRHGQTGNVCIHRLLQNAIVIPQRCTFEILAKRFVFVVGEDNKVQQREIKVQFEQDDIFILQDGIKPEEKIILEGVRQVRDGDIVEYEFRDPTDVLSHLKNKAE